MKKLNEIMDENQKETENFYDSCLVEQSWKLTKLKYDITKVEKNLFLKIVEMCQKYEKGEALDHGCELEMIVGKMSGKESPEITFPIKDLVGTSHNSYECYKMGLNNLASRPFHMPDEKWDFTRINLFEKVQGSEKRGVFKVKMTETFWELFHDRKIFKKIDTGVSYRFKSVFSSRMYELLVGNKITMYYDIDNIMNLLGKESYTPACFLKYVIKVAEKEMLESDNCPFYFETDVVRRGDKIDKKGEDIERQKRKMNPKKGGKIEKLGFFIIQKDIQASPDMEAKKDSLQEQPSILVEKLDEKIKTMTLILFGEDSYSSTIEKMLMELQNLIGSSSLVTKLTEIKVSMEKNSSINSVGSYLNKSLQNIINDAMINQTKKIEIKESAQTVVAKEIPSKESNDNIYDMEFFVNKARLAGISVEECIKKMHAVSVGEGKYKIEK